MFALCVRPFYPWNARLRSTFSSLACVPTSGCGLRKWARYFPKMRPTPMKPGQPCKKTASCARLAGNIPLQTRAKRRQKILGMGHGVSQVKKNRFFGAPPRANPLPSGCARVSECARRKFWGYFGSVEAGKSGRRQKWEKVDFFRILNRCWGFFEGYRSRNMKKA